MIKYNFVNITGKAFEFQSRGGKSAGIAAAPSGNFPYGSATSSKTPVGPCGSAAVSKLFLVVSIPDCFIHNELYKCTTDQGKRT